MGLMQLIPEAASELGVVDPLDPSENVRGGVTCLRQLLDRYDGDDTLALAAYNSGTGTVSRYGNRFAILGDTCLSQKARSKRSTWTHRDTEGFTIYKTYETVGGCRVPCIATFPRCLG